METIFSNISKLSSIGSSNSISWKYVLSECFITASGNGFSVQWKRYSFIHIFLETIIAVRGRPIFKKNLISAGGNRFLQFMQILIRMEVLFGLVKSYFSRNPSFWLVETDIRLITNFVLLFETFFCWWTQFLRLGVNQFSSIFSVPNSGSSFSG